MKKIRICFTLIALMFVMQLAHAQDASVRVSPTSIATNTDFKILGEGLVASRSYTANLVQTNGSFLLLDSFTSSPRGSFTVTSRVPSSVSAGRYLIAIRTVSQIALPVTVASAKLIVLGGLTITTQNSLPNLRPGGKLKVTVSGLMPGTLELVYADGLIYGPVTVSLAQITKTIIIPSDRPATLPASVPLEAINRKGRLILNQASINLAVSPVSANPRIINPPALAASVPRAARLNLNSRFVREDGIRAGSSVSAWWFGADGRVAPLAGNARAFNAQGDFVMQGGLPSTFTQSGVLADGPGEIGFVSNEQRDTEFAAQIGSTNDDSGLQIQNVQNAASRGNLQSIDEDIPGRITILVRNSVNNQPIPNAVVELSSEFDFAQFLNNTRAIAGVNPLREFARDVSVIQTLGPSQFRAGTAQAFTELDSPVNSAPYVTNDCPATLARQVTNSQGIAEFQLDMDKVANVSAVTDVDCTASIGQTGHVDTPCDISSERQGFTLKVFAGAQGFGRRATDPVTGTETYTPETYYVEYQRNSSPTFSLQALPPTQNSATYNSQAFVHPVSVPPLAVGGQVMIEGINLSGLPRRSAPIEASAQNPNGYDQWFAPKATVPFTGALFATLDPIYHLYFSHSGAISSPLTQATFHIDSDNNGTLDPAGTFVLTNNQTAACGLTNVDTYELPFGANSSILGRILRNGPILDVPENTKTDMCGEIRGRDAAGRQGKRRVCFQLVRAGNGVFQGISTLRISDESPGRVIVGGQRNLVPDGNADLEVDDCNGSQSELCELGDQEVRVDNNGSASTTMESVGGSVRSDGFVVTERLAVYSSTQFSSANRQFNSNGDTLADSASGERLSLGSKDPMTVLDITIPLFKYIWGLPPLAGLEMGADFSLLAQFISYVEGGVKPNGGLKIDEALVKQVVDMSIDFYADLSILFDLIDGEAKLRPVLCAGIESGVTRSDGAEFFRPLSRLRLVLELTLDIWVLPPFVNVEVDETDVIASTGDPNCQTDVRTANGTLLSEAKLGTLEIAKPKRLSFAIGRDYEIGQAQTYIAQIARTERDVTDGKLKLVVGIAGDDTPTLITRAFGIRNVSLAYYSQNKAVLAWVQGNVNPPVGLPNNYTSLSTLMRNQHVRYSLWNGSSWSPATDLTPQTTGEGGLTLTACHASQTGCGNGRVLATFTRSSANTFNAMRTRIQRAEFVANAGWSAVTEVDSSGVNDSHATATYRGGVPLVAWLRNTGGSVRTAKARQLAYRDGSNPIRIAAGIPTGVTWPKLEVSSSGQVVMAFTVSEDPAALVSNRQAVHVASIGCNSGSCNFQAVKMKDRRGRSIYAENPIPRFDDEGTIFVGYRGVNYGVDSAGTRRNYADDPVGIRFKTGDVMLFSSTLGAATVDPIAISNDGGGYAIVDLAYDIESSQMIMMGSRNEAAVRQTQARAKAFDMELPEAKASQRGITEDLVMFERPSGVDLAVVEANAAQTVPVLNRPLLVRVQVQNQGTGYAPTLQPLTLSASWDEASSRAGSAVTVNIPAIAAGAGRSISLSVPLPAGYQSDVQRPLYIQIKPSGRIVLDVDNSNNQRVLLLGGMPIPLQPNLLKVPGKALMYLRWQPSTDARVKGYRIYAQEVVGNNPGPWVPIGSSPVEGFVDMTARFGIKRNYRITSYSARGIESIASDVSGLTLATPEVNFEFKNGFE